MQENFPSLNFLHMEDLYLLIHTQTCKTLWNKSNLLYTSCIIENINPQELVSLNFSWNPDIFQQKFNPFIVSIARLMLSLIPRLTTQMKQIYYNSFIA